MHSSCKLEPLSIAYNNTYDLVLAPVVVKLVAVASHTTPDWNTALVSVMDVADPVAPIDPEVIAVERVVFGE